MARLPDEIADVYLVVLEQAILRLRIRIRYCEQVSLDEVHDLMDALHNIPGMVFGDGAWFTEENIGHDLARYDRRWMGCPGSELRESLVQTLEKARKGEFRNPSASES